MIELTIKAFMEQRLSVPVSMEVPSNPPERFVVLKVSHNPLEDYLEQATLVADSYAGSLLEAAKLNKQVISSMDDLVELDEIAGSHRGGDYPLTDTQNKRYRHQAVQLITHY